MSARLKPTLAAARRSTPPRYLALVALAACTAAGCGSTPPNSLQSRRSIENALSASWPGRAAVLSAYDRGGLSAAVQAYQLARGAKRVVPYYRVRPEGAPGANDGSAGALRARADSVMRDGFTYSTHPPLPLRVPLDWSADPYRDRSWRFWLNAWDPLDRVVAAHAATGDGKYLRFAVEIACDWLRQNPLRQSPVKLRRNDFAWYDMAVGLRALQLAYLVDAAARDPGTDADTLATLIAGARGHGWHLADRRNFNDLTNHGIDQAAGLLALGRSLPELRGAADWRAVGEQRLRTMFGKSFSPEGVHREHSPGYHLAMTRLLIALTESGLADDPDLISLREKAERSLAWMIAPDDGVPTIGDTDPVIVSPGLLGTPATKMLPELEYVVTHGVSGRPPTGRVGAFPESGYAVIRSGWPAPGESWRDASYLMFAAGFHSRTHKHADDLSFVWYDGGRWLLIDAGRYGYYYDSPERRYCESTRAHNTVEADGQDYSRRSPETFGSALTDWGEQAGTFFVRGSILRRWPPLAQTRTLVFRPGEWVVVLDEFEALAGHSYEQWFHFAPELDLAVEGTAGSAGLGGGRSLYVVPLTPAPTAPEAVRGEQAPVLQGWYSPRHRTLAPNWALGYRAAGSKVVLATLLCLGRERPEADVERSTIAPDAISLWWRSEGRTEGFTLRRSPPSPRAVGGYARRTHAR